MNLFEGGRKRSQKNTWRSLCIRGSYGASRNTKERTIQQTSKDQQPVASTNRKSRDLAPGVKILLQLHQARVVLENQQQRLMWLFHSPFKA